MSTANDPYDTSINPKQTQKDATDVAGREKKGMVMADKLAGAVKDPVNRALGGNNQKAEGEDNKQDTKGETLPGSGIPGRNY